ncbi:nucleotidyltransferase family protein [Caloramator sp. E03]|uniref:nucleotidyltransferase family protein n=1 Tax=Caloramator sp. E03 TaxID=2576307 RepID=UPI0011101C04|nr:nucleotidyltransferase family protein [Caloramator sp. E03]QCX33629.1 nucleotidyltransferase family protein [Caloramator sp. E03]
MKIDGVILAAGFSTRANTFKMTLEFKGKTILENVIDNMSLYVDRIIIVGGYRIEEIEKIVKRYEKVELIFNDKYEEGMFSSIKKGISKVSGDKFFLTPGDYPLIKPFVYKKLLECEEDIAIPVYNGKRGHPILINSRLIDNIYNPKYTNLREFIKDNNVQFIDVDCIGIIKDIDTMEDYREALNLNDKGG